MSHYKTISLFFALLVAFALLAGCTDDSGSIYYVQNTMGNTTYNNTYITNNNTFNGTSETISHNLLLNLTTSDDHSQYAYLDGRPGGQSWTCGTGANDDCIINGTSSTTKTSSYIIMQSEGGKVGIGETPSSGALQINMTKSSAAQAVLVGNAQPYGSKDSKGTARNLFFLSGSNSSYVGIINEGWLAQATYVGAGSSIIFNVGLNTGTITEGARLTNIGRFGIGTTSPTKALHVVGDLRVTNCSGTPTFDANGNMFCISDSKYKTNIAEMTKGLSTLKNIPLPKSYNYKDGLGILTSQTFYGYMADQLKLVYPEAVITRTDCNWKKTPKGKDKYGEEILETVCIPTGTTTDSIDQMALIVLLTNSVKELSAQSDAQQAQIDELTKRIEKLEKK